MKKLISYAMALLVSFGAFANNGDFHGDAFQKVKEQYGKGLSVNDKVYVQTQVQNLSDMLSKSHLNANDATVQRKRLLDSVYSAQDKRQWLMGFLWEIHKNAVYRVAYGNYSQKLVVNPDQIASHNPNAKFPDDWGVWLMQKYGQSFDYQGNVDKLLVAISRFEQGICSGDRDSYTDGTEIVGGVIGWVIATAVVLPNDPSFGVITLFVAQPAGFIVGDLVGIKVGELIYDNKCGSMTALLASEHQQELSDLIQYH